MYKDKQYLYEQFIVERKSVKDIAKSCNISVSSIEKYLSKFNLKRGNIKNTLDETTIDVNNPVFCYFAGLMITDGYFDKKVDRVSIRVRNTGSYNVLNAIKDNFNFTGNVKVYNGVDNDLIITSKKVIETLMFLGCSREVKVYNTFPSDILYTLSPDCIRMFLRGISDGDGNIKSSGKVFRITLTSNNFLTGMSAFLNNYLGIKTCVKKDRDYYKIEMSFSDSSVFLDFIYKGFDNFRFTDKYCRYARRVKI